uniref:Histidine-containing phosphotransfer protein n=2 Tax=Phaseolus vulgaris TaxID=3885 RepID=V7AU67_PHAVU|nr:hypothetical protein PHAVU_010G156100g [Phaseolus vulgaris]ESW07751.1 hypothetical protein PHAVU_010G156100g [Phaseolus vulgaris]
MTALFNGRYYLQTSNFSSFSLCPDFDVPSPSLSLPTRLFFLFLFLFICLGKVEKGFKPHQKEAAKTQHLAEDRRMPSDRELIESAKTGLPLWMLGLGADLLWADMNRLLAFLFHQGVLDEQFLQLQQLQDESSPNFVSEVVNIYFHESEKLLTNLRALLMEREFWDYKKMGNHLNQFMGSSSSIGAKRVRNVCVAFRAATDQNNRAGCLRALEMLEHEYCYLKNKLHELFQIEQQRALAAGVRYPVQN